MTIRNKVRKLPIIFLLILGFLVLSFSKSYAASGARNGKKSRAASGSRNGGNLHYPRFQIARDFALNIMESVIKYRHAFIIDDSRIKTTLFENAENWVEKIKAAVFVPEKEMFEEDGNFKAALNVPGTNKIRISEAYFDRFGVTTQEAVINIIHETGHKLEITDHQLLDDIGHLLTKTTSQNEQISPNSFKDDSDFFMPFAQGYSQKGDFFENVFHLDNSMFIECSFEDHWHTNYTINLNFQYSNGVISSFVLIRIARVISHHKKKDFQDLSKWIMSQPEKFHARFQDNQGNTVFNLKLFAKNNAQVAQGTISLAPLINPYPVVRRPVECKARPNM